jgi:hypothetical protein
MQMYQVHIEIAPDIRRKVKVGNKGYIFPAEDTLSPKRFE